MGHGLTIATGNAVVAPVPPVVERRGSPRYSTSMPATIVISHYDRVPCVVRDISDSGAKIGLSPRYALSSRFWIVFRHAGIALRASLVWREGAFAGIAFDEPFG